jgi:NADH-quinone oxidoreductase subunit F
MAASEILDLNNLKRILSKYAGEGRSALLPTLVEAQESYGYLSEPLVVAIGEALEVPLVEIHGVIEFYTMLYKEPIGKNVIRICTSPVCAQSGGVEILEALCRHFQIDPGETTADGQYMVERRPSVRLILQSPWKS